tara:strand:+ start:244 stop:1230 length:987 start_codon:yes stop_codon:yes gene_type:complete
MSKVLHILLIFLLLLILTTCSKKEETEDSSTSSSSSSACRGRTNGIKDSSSTLTNLKLPFPNGKSHRVGQTWSGTFSHHFVGGEHSLDFGMEDGSDNISAVGPGKVMAVKEDSNITCSSNCNDGNYVLVDHGSNFYARYVHFCQNCVAVNVGDNITAGNYNLGYAGNTGWSTSPHLHFEMRDFEENCTVKYNLEGASGELTVGQTYTSTNNASYSWDDSNLSKYTGNVFSKSGINLTSNIPWYNKIGDNITITGSITDGKSDVTVFLLPETGGNTQVSDSVKTVSASNTSFNFTYTIPNITAGSYLLGISSSLNGSWTYYNAPLFVIY